MNTYVSNILRSYLKSREEACLTCSALKPSTSLYQRNSGSYFETEIISLYGISSLAVCAGAPSQRGKLA